VIGDKLALSLVIAFSVSNMCTPVAVKTKNLKTFRIPVLLQPKQNGSASGSNLFTVLCTTTAYVIESQKFRN